MPNSRPRPYSLAKRICLTTTLWSLTAAPAALAESPLLRVANGKPVLVEPTQAKGKQTTAEPTKAARPPKIEAAVDDGWIARNHIDRRAPLRDPSPAALSPLATDSPAEKLPATPDRQPPPSAEQPALEVLPTEPLPAADSPRSYAPLPLDGLAPVPLMKVPTLHIAPRNTGIKVPNLAQLPDQAPQMSELGSSASAMNVSEPEDPKSSAAEVTTSESAASKRAVQAPLSLEPASSEPASSEPASTDPLGQSIDDDQPMQRLPAETDAGPRTAALPGLQVVPQRSIPVRRPNVSAKDPSSAGLGSSIRDRAEGLDRPDNEDYLADLDKDNSASETYVGDLTESDSLAEDGSPMAKPVAGKPRVAAKQPIVITPSVQRLKAPMDSVLRYYYARPEHAAKRSSWGMLHSIMVYGVDTQIISGRRRFNAIAWMAGNNVCRGQRIFTIDGNGIAPRNGVGLQGHQGQFLAVFGLVGVPESYPLYVGKQKFSVADLVRHEQDNCRSGVELTFTLIGLSHYLDTDTEWTSSDGQRWDFERVLQEELAQPVIGAACGGTHRLMGLSHALRVRREQGRPITGQWARADQFVNDFIDYAWKLQNPDGSMSTDWFEGRANRNDDDRKVQTTGHIVEWLIGIAPDEQLQDPRMVRAISYLTKTLYSKRSNDWAIGPKGHALRSLALYEERLFGSPPSWRATAVAGQHANSQRNRSR